MIEPKLELKVNKQLNRLELVKARASIRTKRRISEQIENQELKELEVQVAKEEIAKKATSAKPKKEDA